MSRTDPPGNAAQTSAHEITDLFASRSGRLSLSAWATAHARALLGTAGHLARTPVATLLTTAVIGVALALPLGLFLAANRVSGLTGQWDKGAQLSVFLKTAVSDARAQKVAEDLSRWPSTATVQVLSRAEVLRDFEGITSLNGLADAFGADNPLPAVLVISAHGRLTETSARPALQALAGRLRALPTVDFVEFDTDWLNRAQAVLSVVRRGASILAVLLGAGLLLVIGNVVRVLVERHREEIAVSRLCGATDAFIKRPFLYAGALLGALGAIIAWCILKASGAAIAVPLESLPALYPAMVETPTLGLSVLLGLIAVSSMIGAVGAWLATSRQLRTMVP